MIQLKDLCQKASSNIAQKDLEGHEGQYPIYGASGLIGYVDFYKQENPYVAVVKDGAGIGRVMCLPEKSSVIGTMQYILPNEGVNVHYLAFAMEHMNLAKYFSGATIPHIYFKDYGKEKLLERTEKEQKSIAEILSKMDSLISLRKQQIAKLDELVKARFVEMFGDPVANIANWPIERLEKHLTIIGGYAFKSDGFRAKGIPVLRIGNINSGYFQPTNMVYWHDDSTLERYKMHPGDLVISLTGTVGKNDYGNVCILGNDYSEYYLNQRNAKLELNETLNGIYLSELLKFPQIKGRLTGISRGIRQANISNKDILSLPILIPPISLQKQFAAFVERVERQKQTVQQSLEKLELMKKALMQEYFG